MYKPIKLTLKNITTHNNTTYVFRSGEAVLIIGDNQDDPGQKGNGAGKSGFIEGVAIAITGSPVRDASNKEIVRRGEECGEIELTLHNEMLGSLVVINRRIYSSTKSAEVTLHIDGEQVVVSDVNEYNKLILQTLGISKEDFFNFYLLTKMTYTPFLGVGDVKKKAVVNRFSGADKVDETKAYVDVDVKQAQEKVNAIQKSIDNNKGKQSLLSDQITAEEAKYSDDNKSIMVAQKNAELDHLLEQTEDVEKELGLLQNDLQVEEQRLEKWMSRELKPNYEHSITVQEEALRLIEEKLKRRREALPECTKKFDKQLVAQQAAHELIQQALKSNREALKEADKFKRELDNQLAGIIECPACSHKFLVQDKEFNHTTAVAQLAETEEIIKELVQDIEKGEQAEQTSLELKQSINQQIIDAQAVLKKEIEDILLESLQQADVIKQTKEEQREDQLTESCHKGLIESLKIKVRNKQADLDDKLAQAEKWSEQIAAIKQGQSEKLDELEKQLLEYVDEEVELNDKLQVLVDVVKSKEEWITNFKSFKSFLANQSIKNIEDYTNMYLQKMGTNLSVSIEGYRVLSSKKLKEEISVTVLRNGFVEGSYGVFSGGERARIDVAVILAIQSLINLNSPSGGLDLILIDEIMDSVDELGMELVMQGLEHVQRTIMMVSQVSINSLADKTVIIRKKDKISTIC